MSDFALFLAPRVLLLVVMACVMAYIGAGFTSRIVRLLVWACAVVTVLILGGLCG